MLTFGRRVRTVELRQNARDPRIPEAALRFARALQSRRLTQGTVERDGGACTTIILCAKTLSAQQAACHGAHIGSFAAPGTLCVLDVAALQFEAWAAFKQAAKQGLEYAYCPSAAPADKARIVCAPTWRVLGRTMELYGLAYAEVMPVLSGETAFSVSPEVLQFSLSRKVVAEPSGVRR
ncbi:MAG: hypothetical protein EOP64_00065 [Sphingomonas sp.]|nr:MAG: hypothetical protein EOP64_00065 [Sphingomonas sp.]